MNTKAVLILIALFSALTLAACGGGGGGGDGGGTSTGTCVWDSSTFDNCTWGS